MQQVKSNMHVLAQPFFPAWSLSCTSSFSWQHTWWHLDSDPDGTASRLSILQQTWEQVWAAWVLRQGMAEIGMLMRKPLMPMGWDLQNPVIKPRVSGCKLDATLAQGVRTI